MTHSSSRPGATLATPHALVSHYFEFARRTVIESESTALDSERPTYIAAAIILVVGAVEAYLNIAGRLMVEQKREFIHAGRIQDDLESKVSFGRKLRTWPELLFGRPLPMQAETPKAFLALVELRNHLMHFTSTYDHIEFGNVTIRGLTDMTKFYELDSTVGRAAVDLAESMLFELIRLQDLSEERALLAGTMWSGRPVSPEELEAARSRDRARTSSPPNGSG
jgi:hypothetical protein